MALEFNRLTEQVQKLGSMVEQLDFDLGDRLRTSIERFAAAGDVDAVRERIEWVRRSDISGYRGAALLDGDDTPVNAIGTPPDDPGQAVIVAADGSQIYPDDQAPVHYYLINVGLFLYDHGAESVPQQITEPELVYHPEIVHDEYGQVISNRTVDARRTVSEMRALAKTAWELKNVTPGPIISLYDNSLMFSAGGEVTDGDKLLRDYHGALQQLYDVQANGVPSILGGYVDNPRGSVVLRLLHLLTLDSEDQLKAHKREIEAGGDLEGLRDRNLFNAVLEPGERSAVMVQNSPRNFEYKRYNPSHEVAFFYLKVASAGGTAIARVDIPAWVARDADAVNALHAALVKQAALQGRNPYPYALTRADELAYVSARDKAKLEEIINLELRRKGISPGVTAPKMRGKELARSFRQGYEIDTELK